MKEPKKETMKQTTSPLSPQADPGWNADDPFRGLVAGNFNVWRKGRTSPPERLQQGSSPKTSGNNCW
jgi:hypothetical protein